MSRKRFIAGSTGRVGGRRAGAGRKKGGKNKIRVTDRHIVALARPWTDKSVEAAAMLAFGTIDPEAPNNSEKWAEDPWLRLAAFKWLVERAWGRAPLEINVQLEQNVRVKYTREQLASMSLEQISALWREQIAPPPPKLIEGSKIEAK